MAGPSAAFLDPVARGSFAAGHATIAPTCFGRISSAAGDRFSYCGRRCDGATSSDAALVTHDRDFSRGHSLRVIS
jgi:hypothetical protein